MLAPDALSAAVASGACRAWLIKSEPDPHIRDGVDLGSYPYARIASVGSGLFSGVRNAQARNFMRDQMRMGDAVLYYHASTAAPGVYGICKLTNITADADASTKGHPLFDAKHCASKPVWFSANLAAVRAMQPPVSLAALRAAAAATSDAAPAASGTAGAAGRAAASDASALASLALFRQPRLSVQPVTAPQWAAIMALESQLRGGLGKEESGAAAPGKRMPQAGRKRKRDPE